MKVHLLTPEQAESLMGQLYGSVMSYNPILDGNGNWVLSTQEADQTTNADFLWVKSLPLIDWVSEPIQM